MNNNYYSTLYNALEKDSVKRYTSLNNGSVFLTLGDKIVYGEKDESLSYMEETLSPEPHLVIFGAGHISKALAELAHLLSFKTTVIDEREEIINPTRFPYASLICMPYKEVFSSSFSFYKPYYIIVTHGHTYDKDALRYALNHNSEYIGMIGSKTKVRATMESLKEEGFSSEKLSGVHSPIGLSIGAVTPEEIAISIMAEVISVYHRTKNNVALSLDYLKSLIDKNGISARIVEKKGSAPRAIGSELFYSKEGELFGTIGGGSVEKRTIEECKKLLSSGSNYKLLDYTLTSQGDLGMVCGGSVKILLEKFD